MGNKNEVTRYKKYAEIPETLLKEAKSLTAASPYRQHFHIEPETGYLNDPNGFSYFDGKYHLCYQWSPLRYLSESNVWFQGWFHLTSEDLVNWTPVGPLIEPDTQYDTHGAYSGSALDLGDKLAIFYTGNVRDEQWVRTPYQVIAYMDKKGDFVRQLPPALTGQPAGYTDHFRDPKLWRQGDDYYAVIGAQREDKRGSCLILHSADIHHWQVLGEMKTNVSDTGYMWECPDYFEINDKGVLIYCPQGLKKDAKESGNIYDVFCLIGDPLNLSDLTFNNIEPQKFDFGFDIYAVQTTRLPDGRRIAIGWMGVSEMEYPTEKYGHCGTLTIPRELSVNGDRLQQRPIKELMKLRGACQSHRETLIPGKVFNFHSGTVFESIITFKSERKGQLTISLRASENGERKTDLIIDLDNHAITLDREYSGEAVNTAYGTRRTHDYSFSHETKIQIFSDTTSLEIFIDDGLYVSSTRIFPLDGQGVMRFQTTGTDIDVNIDCWALAESRVKDETGTDD
ncbi:sucrose-6-phosphate hydrolase [Brenneria populi subsp. brevivirga]|uniref:glycoside hydrolase family 32 protein n=1 Tax=Brenneria populi TaxID=1505588 RepID=UPI002E175A9A|nr:sucrose-6-phosphate hydrolase [Brenneria populi subsp. brevivirga]